MSVKLYRNNESGEVVAISKVGLFANVLHNDGTLSTHIFKTITDNYTALPEVPEVGEWIHIKDIPNAHSIGSDEWAIAMMKRGEKVQVSTWNKDLYLWMDDHGTIFNEHGNFVSFEGRKDNWQLYEEPKPIVEWLPHEFVERQAVLAFNGVKWIKAFFVSFGESGNESFPYITSHLGPHGKVDNYGSKYCLPYAGNEHLEGTVTDGEHGAVPKGYVPPHVPRLGDETYWIEGDDVVNLSTNKEYSIVISEHNRVTFYPKKSNNDNIFLPLDALNGGYWNGHRYLRVWYHKGSYVRDDGTVHEHIPTRPYKIIDTDTDGA